MEPRGWDGLEETPGEYRSLLSQPLPTPPYFSPPQEKVIPSVVIQPASNNEGEEEHEGTMDAEYRRRLMTRLFRAPPVRCQGVGLEEQKAARASQPAPSTLCQAFQEVPRLPLQGSNFYFALFLFYSVSGKYNSKICHL